MWHSDALQSKFKDACDHMVQIIRNSDLQYKSIGIFGSYAREDYTLSSDLDLCVIVDKIPERRLKGYLYEEAENLGIDLCFISSARFREEDSLFLNNLRKDYKEVANDPK